MISRYLISFVYYYEFRALIGWQAGCLHRLPGVITVRIREIHAANFIITDSGQ